MCLSLPIGVSHPVIYLNHKVLWGRCTLPSMARGGPEWGLYAWGSNSETGVQEARAMCRASAKCFTCVVSLNSHENLVRKLRLSPLGTCYVVCGTWYEMKI